jgi:hypothetical protein
MKNTKIIEGAEEWLNPRHKIVLDHNVGSRGFQKVAELCCTYVDLVHFFGEPMKWIGQDKRVEWGFREEQTGIGATIYDDNKDIPLEEVFHWAVGGSCDRSLEMIGQIFQEQMDKGKKFISKPLPEDESSN